MRNLFSRGLAASAMALLWPGPGMAQPSNGPNAAPAAAAATAEQPAAMTRKELKKQRAAYRRSIDGTPREQRRELMRAFDAKQKKIPVKAAGPKAVNARAAYRASLQSLPREERRKLMQAFDAKRKPKGSKGAPSRHPR